MPNENNLLPEHAQLAAVLDNPDAIQRIKEPTEKVQIAAVQKKPELPPTTGILAAARRLVFRMKGNRKLGEPDTEAVKEFFDEVKSFKH